MATEEVESEDCEQSKEDKTSYYASYDRSDVRFMPGGRRGGGIYRGGGVCEGVRGGVGRAGQIGCEYIPAPLSATR